MEVKPGADLQSVADSNSTSAPTLLIADPHEGENGKRMADRHFDKNVVVAIGPEGGFTDEEIELAVKLGFQKVRFGSSILRIETAAITAAVIFGFVRDSQTAR